MQKGVEFENSDYNNLKKVYSIWICMYPPRYCENTIIRYRMKQEVLFGKLTGNKEFRYDLMEVLIVNLPQNVPNETDEPSLNGMLKTLLTPELPAETVIERLEHIYHIPMVEREKGEFGEMCNLGEAILEQGIEQGIQKERIEGIRNVMQIVLDLGGDMQTAVAKAAERYHEDEKRILDIWEKSEK